MFIFFASITFYFWIFLGPVEEKDFAETKEIMYTIILEQQPDVYLNLNSWPALKCHLSG